MSIIGRVIKPSDFTWSVSYHARFTCGQVFWLGWPVICVLNKLHGLLLVDVDEKVKIPN